MSMATHPGSHDATELSRQDFILAGGFHLFVVVLLLLLNAWQQHTPPITKSVEVHLISKAELEKRMHHHAPKHTAHKKRAKPVPKHHKKKPVHKPEPVRHHKKTPPPPARKAHKTAHKPKPAPKKSEEPFDPFKPLASSSDRTGPSAAASSDTSKDLTEDLASQLSAKEKDRYIAMIIDAIEQHWKVPAISADVHDPHVEMTLNPDGSVSRVEIVASSGSAAVDASAIRAIHAASPFTIPRQQYELFRTMSFHLHLLH